MTQKERILAMLKAHGSDGVGSDLFIKNFMPRAAARVQELKEQGYAISSEREGKYVRWTLNVGSSTEGSTRPRTEGLVESGSPYGKTFGVASGVAASPLLPVPVEAHARTIPSAYDCWEDAA